MNRDQRTLPSNRPSTVKNYRTVAMLKLRYIAIVIFCLVVANYIYSFTTLATSKLSNSLRSVTTTTTTEDDNNDGYTPTWKEWYASLVGGGAIKYTRGSTLRTCVDDLPIPGVATGAFSQPSKYWSAQSIVQFDGAQDGTPYADGLPRLVDLRASCCKSQITWPKCWADDTAPEGLHPQLKCCKSLTSRPTMYYEAFRPIPTVSRVEDSSRHPWTTASYLWNVFTHQLLFTRAAWVHLSGNYSQASLNGFK